MMRNSPCVSSVRRLRGRRGRRWAPVWAPRRRRRARGRAVAWGVARSPGGPCRASRRALRPLALMRGVVRSQSCCADLRRGRRSNPTDSAQVVPQYLRYPAQNPTEGAPIRASGSVQRALFTRAGGAAAGWLRNSGISGAGTMGQRAETVGSYNW